MALGIWSRFQSLIFGGAIGAAASEAIAPQLEPAKQRAWSRNQVRILDPLTLAELVASGAITVDQAASEAARSGLNPSRVRALVYLTLEAPDVSEALRMRRRNLIDPSLGIDEAQLDHVLAKAKIEKEYWPALKQLTDEPLDPAIVAQAIQRGILRDPGFLPVGPPTTEGKVRAFPQSSINPLAEAAGNGINRERLFVETALVGNPVGPEQAARALFRGIIEQTDFDRAIAEGRTRNEWGFVYRDVAREIPSAIQAVNARLRGWIDDAAMYARTAAWGMSKPDTDLLFLIQGRPLSWHQVWIGLQRGGELTTDTTGIDPAFLKALQESDIRPEWYQLAWAQRYNYPTAFVLRTLTQDGDISGAEAEQILLYEGWEPKLAHKVAQKWAGGGTASVPPEVKSARTRLLTTLHKGYVTQGADDASVLASLNAVPYPAELSAALLEVWSVERAFLQGQSPNEPGPLT